MIEDMINRIVENGKNEDMEELSEILDTTINKLKTYDEKCYDKMYMKLYKMAYGEVLTEEMAHNIVSSMRPYGEHWTISDTTGVKNQYSLNDISDIDFYVVMNSAYNDYHDLFAENLDYYVKYTKDFIKDEDAKENKVFKYFTIIA